MPVAIQLSRKRGKKSARAQAAARWQMLSCLASISPQPFCPAPGPDKSRNHNWIINAAFFPLLFSPRFGLQLKNNQVSSSAATMARCPASPEKRDLRNEVQRNIVCISRWHKCCGSRFKSKFVYDSEFWWVLEKSKKEGFLMYRYL